MNTLPALPWQRTTEQTGATPVLDASAFGYLTVAAPDQTDRLPTEAEEADLRRELMEVNEPIAMDSLRREVGAMIASFPQNRHGDDRGYVLALAQNLAEFPHDVVRQACREITQTSKFVPAVAEVYELCLAKVRRRREALVNLNHVPVERERRRERAAKTKLAEAVAAADRCLYRMGQKRGREALTSAIADFVPLDTFHMGLPLNWYQRLRKAALRDIRAEWECWPGEPQLPDAVAGYVSTLNPVNLGDDWPPAAPDYQTEGEP